jgi:hypothetical protein
VPARLELEVSLVALPESIVGCCAGCWACIPTQAQSSDTDRAISAWGKVRMSKYSAQGSCAATIRSASGQELIVEKVEPREY